MEVPSARGDALTREDRLQSRGLGGRWSRTLLRMDSINAVHAPARPLQLWTRLSATLIFAGALDLAPWSDRFLEHQFPQPALLLRQGALRFRRSPAWLSPPPPVLHGAHLPPDARVEPA